MSRSLSRPQALVLGLVVVLGLALGGVGFLAIASRGWLGKDALQLRVGFRQIRGVEVGTRVRIQGIDAGEVVEITPPQQLDGLVLLRLRIQGAYRHLVRKNSTVQIVSEGMIGGKVLEIHPTGLAQRPGNGTDTESESLADNSPADEDTLLRSEPSTELTDALGQVVATLKGIQEGKGTLGKLAQDPRAYDALVKLITHSVETVDRSKDTIVTVQRTTDAFSRLPLIGSYVEDPVRLLVRPHFKRYRQCFAEEELFEPGRAVLTPAGKEKLDRLDSWLAGLRQAGSEIVVVSYADPLKSEPRPALEVTRQQSETVVEYLRTKHSAHKLGWFSWRKLIALGQGTFPPPQPEQQPLPPARIEILVFVPQV